MTEDEAKKLQRDFGRLTPSQANWVATVIEQFQLPHRFERLATSDLISELVLQNLGDTLRVHHAFSRQALSKDRFEFALERALIAGGHTVAMPVSRTNRGHDITVDGIPFNLKTEAARTIRQEELHISKFMELGKGAWELGALRDMFLQHMQNYERILQFRCLKQGPTNFFYELVEIPKPLLLEARDARLELRENSKQNPKPGYGYVRDEHECLKFALYFDAGTERKLQIKHIRKNLCIEHGRWQFESRPL
jgi:type II restriction enzyme